MLSLDLEIERTLRGLGRTTRVEKDIMEDRTLIAPVKNRVEDINVRDLPYKKIRDCQGRFRDM